MTAVNDHQAFDPLIMAGDMGLIRGLVRNFFNHVGEEDWDRPTESRPDGWTLKQAFCHVVAVSELIYTALDGVVNGSMVQDSPLSSRYELAAFNQKQIRQREHLPPEFLLQSFLESIIKTEELLNQVSTADMEKLVPLNVYNRPLTVAELAGNQLVHPSIVHGAQLANGIGVDPLWRHFSTGLMERQLTRFLHVFSHAYWPERGGDLTAVLNIRIRGEGGGQWHVRLDQGGGAVGHGLVKRPTTNLLFTNPDAFCSAFTLQLSPMKGVFTGKVFAWGNLPLAFKLSHLFMPT